MNAARQAIRWSIPGWLHICTIVTFQAIIEVFFGGPGRLGAIVGAIPNALVAVLVASGLPLGFLIYQAYHAWYGSVLPFDVVGHDRGAEVLANLPPAALNVLARETNARPDLEPMTVTTRFRWFPNAILRLAPQHRTSTGRDRYRRRQQHNWELVRFFLNLVVLRQQHNAFKEEFLDLSDIYHALGASRISILLGYMLSVAASITLQTKCWGSAPRSMVLALITNTLLTLLLLWTLERNRRRTQVSSITLLQFAFHWHVR